MSLSIRSRIALSFSLLFGFLLALVLGAIYFFLSASLYASLKKEIIHDYSQIMFVFEEEPVWEEAKKELYRVEADEFNIQIRILDSDLNQVFVSYALDEAPISVESENKEQILSGPYWTEGKIGKTPHLILTQKFFLQGKTPHYCQIWKSKTDMITLQKRYLIIALFVTPFILIFSILIGLLFSKKALQPLDLIRQKADKIQTSDLSARLPYPKSEDETHKLTHTLNQLLGRIEKSFEGMKRFTSDASHELRIPLTNLKGMIEVALRKERSVEEYQNDFKDALEEVDRLNDLVRNLLTLARVDANKVILETSEVNVKTFIDEFIKWVEPLAQKKEIKLVKKNSLPVSVVMDEDKIKQILLILTDNAIKYTPEGGTVTISTQEKTNGIVMSVSDTGKGIPAEAHEKVFERFYRLDESRDRREGGTGLGLSIARSIAEAHKGTLTVQSRENQGSTFSLFLPFK